MKKATAVIGAGYGDEGKGVVTSTLARKHDIIVRHNGGSQAAHTVEINGTRHVFGHFGSGTLQGVPTYLSQYFIVNPIIFRKEWEELEEKGITPKVFIDLNAVVTTPFDMILNQMLETNRGCNRHGSCGLGINETITRNEHYKRFTVHDIEHLLKINELELLNVLGSMFNNYIMQRGDYLHIDTSNLFTIASKALRQYAVDCRWMVDHAVIFNNSLLNAYDSVLFEGAQGLMIDEYYGEFPHVTRSRTGINNVHAIISNVNVTVPLETFYVTRHYSTRHGAGPLKYELPFPHWASDETNVYNEWQDHLRFGLLDFDILNDMLKLDSKPTGINTENNLVVTCMDQNDAGVYTFCNNGDIDWCQKDKFINKIMGKIGWPVCTTSSPGTQEELNRR